MKEEEEYTTIREIIMSKEFEGKKMYMGVAATPTEGNREALMTTFITRRSGDREKNRRTAEAGQEYIKNVLVNDIINTVGREEAMHVIAQTIINDLEANKLEVNEEDMIEIEDESSI